MFLFSGPTGRVIRLDDNSAPGGLRLLDLPDKGTQIDYDTQRSIITKLQVDQSVSAQFSHMLGGEIYVHVFGDRIGSVILSGLSFPYGCENPEDTQPGLEKMLEWYRQNKLSTRFLPIRAVIGDTPFDAFLVNFTAGAQDPATGLVEWTAPLVTLPDGAQS